MKVIFLDIDGVLDVFISKSYLQTLLPEAVERLKVILERTGAEVVVISTWRYGSEKYRSICDARGIHQQECDNWPQLVQTLEAKGMRIWDVTPWREDLPTRTAEVLCFLEEHPEVDSYVILDDCYGDDYSGSEELRKRLVFVDALKGLQEKDVEAATEILSEFSR